MELGYLIQIEIVGYDLGREGFGHSHQLPIDLPDVREVHVVDLYLNIGILLDFLQDV